MKVLLLTRYGRLGVTSRIRFLQYLPYLTRHGIDVHIAPFLEDDYVTSLYEGRRSWEAVLRAYARRLKQILDARHYDLLWIEKELLPWFPALPERLIRNYVVDYDDATLHAYDSHTNPFVRLILGQKIRTVMANASVVVAGNSYLVDYANKAGARSVEVVPTTIDLERYGAVTEPHNDVFTIGWIGTPWTARYLPAIRPALERACTGRNARVILIGSGPVDLGKFAYEIRAWSESSEVTDLRRLDVGTMPLPDEPYERGKCGYKLLQYMACGRPVIASPVGVNREIVEHGIDGYLASTDAEWIEAFEKLRTNEPQRRAMGRAARFKVESAFSLAIHAPRLLRILEKAGRETRA